MADKQLYVNGIFEEFITPIINIVDSMSWKDISDELDTDLLERNVIILLILLCFNS